MKNGAIDIETYRENEKITPYCLGIMGPNEEFFNFYGNDVIKNGLELLKERKIKKIFAHNLMFDGLVIIRNLPNGGEAEGKIINLRLYEVTLKSGKHTITMRCSYHLMPISISNLGEKIGYPKLPYPYNFINEKTIFYKGIKPNLEFGNCVEDYEKVENIIDVKRMTIEYCKRDLTITIKFIEKLFDILSRGSPILNRSLSLSSFSGQLFKINFNESKIATKLDSEIDNKFRQTYRGGRVEVWGNPNKVGIIHHFDFSGHYAHIMKNEKIFFGNGKKIEKPNNIEKPGFYSAKVRSKLKIPILPKKINNKLVFPNGIFEVFLPYQELNLFVENGGEILELKTGYIFEKYENCFEGFIKNQEKLIEMGGVEKLIGKLINNALPGRLGMGEKDEKTILVTKESRNEYDIIEEIEISDNLFAIKIRNKNKIENIQSNVIIASQVTALGRIRLWKAMKEVMKAGGRLLYTDTDSIFAEYAESMVGKRIGEMFYDPKKNDTILKKAVFCKPKCYGYELLCGKQVIKIKGIRDTGKGNLKNLMESFESNTMLKFDQTYFSKKNFNISILDIQKEIKLDNYEKRIGKKGRKKTKAIGINE